MRIKLVVATADNDNYLYYYDPVQQKWVILGTLGSANSGGTSAENLSIEERDVLAPNVPVSNKFIEGSYITFKDGSEINQVNASPIIWPWINLENYIIT